MNDPHENMFNQVLCSDPAYLDWLAKRDAEDLAYQEKTARQWKETEDRNEPPF